MPRLIWSSRALADVARLHAFLAGKNPMAARRAIATIRAGVKVLRQHPEIGRPLGDLSPEFREWVIEFGSGSYVASYRFDGSLITILSVRHGREAGY